MGIFSIDTQIKISIVKLMYIGHKVDGVVLELKHQDFDGPYPVFDESVKEISLKFGEEVTI